MLEYYRKKIRISIEKVLGRRLLPLDMLPKGVDLYYDLKNDVDTEHFRSVFDVGSNKGQSVSQYLNWFPNANVYGFEPSGGAFHELRSNFSTNNRVEVINVALGSKVGSKELLVGNDSKRGGFHLDKTGDGVVERKNVRVEKLDNFCKSNNIKEINFLKVDTEGHDMDVLKGAHDMLDGHCIDFVQSEVTTDYENDLHCSVCSMIEYMRGHKYKIYGFYNQVNDWRGQSPCLRRVDAVFMRSTL
jgi:FkbM family methyltransferase